ncbi:MAG: hypothetical protein ACTHMS_16880 [Jatrophihabitans sp.]|uniref:hypothetical protein n=1 Tax=Jatrophihabitans sp. TaxID=1932789 RepID=UPI003F820D33
MSKKSPLVIGSLAVAAAAAALAGAASAQAATPTTLKPTSITLHAAHATVAPKHKDTLTATLKSGRKALAGETVLLEKRAPHTAQRFTVVQTRTTDAKGRTTFTVLPGARKGHKEQYEVVFVKTSTYKGSHSAVITLTVS